VRSPLVPRSFRGYGKPGVMAEVAGRFGAPWDHAAPTSVGSWGGRAGAYPKGFRTNLKLRRGRGGAVFEKTKSKKNLIL
jgi:hypothetical protein